MPCAGAHIGLCRKPDRRGQGAILLSACAGYRLPSAPFASILAATPFQKLLEELAFRARSEVVNAAPLQVTAETTPQIGVDAALLRGRPVEPLLRRFEPGPARHLRRQVHVLPFGMEAGLLQLAKTAKEGVGKARNLFVSVAALGPVEDGQDIADRNGFHFLAGRNEIEIGRAACRES